ncbi:hypothetical protein NG798_09825 [Ancylothrix sp. C2]|uniref:hypothetical protein n=1 Tax=Ancylothrix sp. D3o TaxID=2953691 RepID=UPI0021BB8B58|nr:hypothetical protein [Ancylothrix sp. D3o]MCT7950083.1 hypothetical protein [Ancylothrix sp. D3o]
MILEVCLPNLLINQLFQDNTAKKRQFFVTPASVESLLHKEQFIAEVIMRPC